MVKYHTGFRPFMLTLVFLLFSSVILSASDYLSGTFWWETEPFVGGVDYPQNEEEAIKYLLEEAQWVFSGMIYGFAVDYTPADSSREIEQVFNMTPLGSIPWGDPRLKVITGWRERTRHFTDIGYTLEGMTLLRRQAWESNVHPQASQLGLYTMYEGFRGRRRAVENAALQAIRDYYRQRIGSRPTEIRGEIALFDVPYIIIKEGAYHARVRICMDLEVTGQVAY
ncbi:MAG: hypothetical protein JEY99_01785 [Spirochaetales bacterium]|nr:hypothetical protein [Spirochaetales bacterium]